MTKTQGSRYDSRLDTADIAKLVRSEIRARQKAGTMPRCKVSVRIERYSGGSSITAAVKEWDGQIHSREWVEWTDDSSRMFAPAGVTRHTDAASELISEIEGILAAYQRKHVDLHTDLYNTNFHARVEFDFDLRERDLERVRAEIEADRAADPVIQAERAADAERAALAHVAASAADRAAEGERCGHAVYPGGNPEDGPAEPCVLSEGHEGAHLHSDAAPCDVGGHMWNEEDGVRWCAKCGEGSEGDGGEGAPPAPERAAAIARHAEHVAEGERALREGGPVRVKFSASENGQIHALADREPMPLAAADAAARDALAREAPPSGGPYDKSFVTVAGAGVSFDLRLDFTAERHGGGAERPVTDEVAAHLRYLAGSDLVPAQAQADAGRLLAAILAGGEPPPRGGISPDTCAALARVCGTAAHLAALDELGAFGEGPAEQRAIRVVAGAAQWYADRAADAAANVAEIRKGLPGTRGIGFVLTSALNSRNKAEEAAAKAREAPTGAEAIEEWRTAQRAYEAARKSEVHIRLELGIGLDEEIIKAPEAPEELEEEDPGHKHEPWSAAFVVLNFETWRDHCAAIHAEGCEAIAADRRRHGGTSDIVEGSLEAAIATACDLEMEEMGYTRDDVKVHDCAKRAARDAGDAV